MNKVSYKIHMHLDSLFVLHHEKKSSSENISLKKINYFYLDTCQRQLWIFKKPTRLSYEAIGELYSGENAYRFLLEITTGLQSPILGETDVFGQFKQAWITCQKQNQKLAENLFPWIQKIFEDTKEIRSQYLQKIGGISYGSLVRMLLQTQPKAPLLLIGAGNLAQSLKPYLADFELLQWNRAQNTLLELEKKLKQKPHLLLCIPPHTDLDQKLISLCKNQNTIIHMGYLDSKESIWESSPHFYCLKDIFTLQQSQDQTRVQQTILAKQACSERARLRSMGHSLSIPHGWEDLVAFA